MTAHPGSPQTLKWFFAIVMIDAYYVSGMICVWNANRSIVFPDIKDMQMYWISRLRHFVGITSFLAYNVDKILFSFPLV